MHKRALDCLFFIHIAVSGSLLYAGSGCSSLATEAAYNPQVHDPAPAKVDIHRQERKSHPVMREWEDRRMNEERMGEPQGATIHRLARKSWSQNDQRGLPVIVYLKTYDSGSKQKGHGKKRKKSRPYSLSTHARLSQTNSQPEVVG